MERGNLFASLDEAFSPLLTDGMNAYVPYPNTAAVNARLNGDDDLACPRKTGFAPETVQASECISRYHSLVKEMKALDDQSAMYIAKLEQVSKFAQSYAELLACFSPISAIFFESLPVSDVVKAAPAADSAPADAPAADAEPKEDPHQELNELRDALNNPYGKLLKYEYRWAPSMKKELADLRDKRVAIETECSALRQFIAEGIRAMKSENPGSCEGINQCAICFTETVNRVVVPCGHTFCLGCLDTHCNGNAAGRHARYPCPTCRGQMEKVIKLYL